MKENHKVRLSLIGQHTGSRTPPGDKGGQMLKAYGLYTTLSGAIRQHRGAPTKLVSPKTQRPYQSNEGVRG